MVVQPDKLTPLPLGRRFEDMLVVRFQLLSNNAAILMETRRAGPRALAAEDPDLVRAATEFDLYTWA